MSDTWKPGFTRRKLMKWNGKLTQTLADRLPDDMPEKYQLNNEAQKCLDLAKMKRWPVS